MWYNTCVDDLRLENQIDCNYKLLEYVLSKFVKIAPDLIQNGKVREDCPLKIYYLTSGVTLLKWEGNSIAYISTYISYRKGWEQVLKVYQKKREEILKNVEGLQIYPKQTLEIIRGPRKGEQVNASRYSPPHEQVVKIGLGRVISKQSLRLVNPVWKQLTEVIEAAKLVQDWNNLQRVEGTLDRRILVSPYRKDAATAGYHPKRETSIILEKGVDNELLADRIVDRFVKR